MLVRDGDGGDTPERRYMPGKEVHAGKQGGAVVTRVSKG